jgi:hypothetical protein
MTTRINVTIGDQRLLQNVKTRAAANQQALDDRQQNTKTETKASTALEQTAERRNGVPENVVDRRPAAQRRPDKLSETGYIGSKYLTTRFIPNTSTSYTENWDEQTISTVFVGTPPVATLVYGTIPRTNTYTYSTGGLQTLFNSVEKINKTQQGNKQNLVVKSIQDCPEYLVPYTTESLNWTVRTKDVTVLNGALVPVITTAPVLPVSYPSIRRIRTLGQTLACTTTATHYSVLIRIYSPSSLSLGHYADSNFYFTVPYTGNSKFRYTINSDIFSDTFSYKQFTTYGYSYGKRNYIDIGIYSAYDYQTNTMTTRSVDLTAAMQADPQLSPYYDTDDQSVKYFYYSNLNLQDPHYSLFQAHIASYAGSSALFIKLQGQYYSVGLWPYSVNYDNITKSIYMFAAAPTGYTGSLRDLMTYKYTTSPLPSTYLEVRSLFSGLTATALTRAALENLGFKYVETFDISWGNTLYDITFPVIKSDGKYRHPAS